MPPDKPSPGSKKKWYIVILVSFAVCLLLLNSLHGGFSPGYMFESLMRMVHTKVDINKPIHIINLIHNDKPVFSTETILTTKLVSTTKPINTTTPIRKIVQNERRHIAVQFIGRFGNQIFGIASLLGIAHANNLIPVIPSKLYLPNVFKINISTYSGKFKHSRTFAEKYGCAFDERAMKLGSHEDVLLIGYLQSWKYFESNKDFIKQQLTFKDPILSSARNIFYQIAKNAISSHSVYVGVHVRRGDVLVKQFIDYGYVHAGKEYLIKAMDFMRKKYKNVLFIVSSDDIPWCEKNLDAGDVRFIGKKNKPEVDMAILTFCNHSIMTTGSYGWWSSYLAGGETIYFGGYPRPHTELYRRFNKDTYYLPHWIKL